MTGFHRYMYTVITNKYIHNIETIGNLTSRVNSTISQKPQPTSPASKMLFDATAKLTKDFLCNLPNWFELVTVNFWKICDSSWTFAQNYPISEVISEN